MLKLLPSVLIAAAFALKVFAAPAADFVPEIPGYADGALKSKHYSGFLKVGNISGVEGFIHYWFIESENDPANDPLVYWTNGGPGGSGISTGLLTELGQISVNDDSFSKNSSEIKSFYNPYSWSRVANMLFVSQPKGVGFSYCANQTEFAECVNNDLSAAQDSVDLLRSFYAKFPEYEGNDLYLTAESYGGIYIPMMIDQIEAQGGFKSLKGAAIGDGCWGNEVGLCAFSSGKAQQIQAEFFGGHAMYDQVLYKKIITECGAFSNEDVQKKSCSDALGEMNHKIGDFDVYNVYDTCGSDTTASAAKRQGAQLSDYRQLMDVAEVKIGGGVEALSSGAHPQLSGALNDWKCGGDRASEALLQSSAVKKALHVGDQNQIGMHYIKGPMNGTFGSGDLRPLYKRLIQKYRFLIYSGDVDGCVPYWGTEEWVRELGFEVAKDWRPWMAPLTEGSPPQRAGYVIDYATNSFKYVTVQGAGHMVPQHKPGFALSMITKFLKNQEF